MTKGTESPPPDENDDGLSIELDTTDLDEALRSLENEGLFLSNSGTPLRRSRPLGPDAAVLAGQLQTANEDAERLRGEAQAATTQQMALLSQLAESREATRVMGLEFERYRTRARKDAEEAERRGEERALRALIEIFDNVERARLHDASDPARMVAGLQIIVEQFRRQLGRVGLERVPATRGSTFDPEIHEAVAHVDGDEVREGCVVDEVTPGFRLRGRLFRPARVTVATRPAGA